MKRGSFCDIANVNKEKQGGSNNTTLKDSAKYIFVRRFKCPYFGALHSYAKIMGIVDGKHLLYHSDKVYQVIVHGNSSQMILIGLERKSMLLIYYLSF